MPRFDWEHADEAYKAIYGLPVTYNPHDHTYKVGNVVITASAFDEFRRTMTNRPYKDLTSSELSRVLSGQLASGQPRYSQGPVTTSQDPLWSVPAFSSTANVETTFRVGADGRPEAVTRLVDKPSEGAARNGGESELAWLRRRVNEICWSPK